MLSGSYIAVSFVSYSIPLFLLTGYLILQFDIKEYRVKKMEKERKLSKCLGWVNLALGAGLMVVDHFIL
ncbi:CLC_0170 family protein [Paenibacillus silvisoli]|uniref:CLC_0170 family protein n=1 Tax=Paenibacillus silvisoli TaxID=3110539 RepID=UPI0028056671|nr:CLC_0170 family protein [Paenibacillus silvisoli]